MSALLQDLRFDFRLWSRNPVTAATTILTLALGIGACTTIFSVVHGVLLQPLPFSDPDRLVTLWETHPEQASDFRVASFEAAALWSTELTELEALAASRLWRPILVQSEDLISLTGASVSPEFFPLLGVQPILGRVFAQHDVEPGSAPVVILSHGLWQSRFGSDQNILGAQVLLEGAGTSSSATIIGVLPPDLQVDEPLVFGPPEIWSPFALEPSAMVRGRRYLQVVGKLAEGASIEQARSHLRSISQHMEHLYPESNRGWSGSIESVSEQLVAPVRPALLVLLAAVGFVFFVACCNAAISLLSQATTRRQEFAVRLALGATPRRVGRQILTECLLMAAVSSLLGLVLAHAGLSLVMRHAFATLPRRNEVGLDFEALIFSLLLTLMTIVFFGLVPALRAAKAHTYGALRETGVASHAGGSQGGRLRQSLVLAEIALSLILLVTAALMLQSFSSLAAADPGFEHRQVLTLRLQLPRSLYPEKENLGQIYQRMRSAINTLPAVQEIGLVNHLPMQGASMSTRAAASSAPEEPIQIELRGTSNSYFETLDVPLLSGRDFDSSELTKDSSVAVLSQSTAEHLWPGEDPIGKTIRVDWGAAAGRRVIGMVGDVHHHGVRSEIQPTVYLPFVQLPHRAMVVVIRTQSPQSLIADVRTRIRDLGETLVVDEIHLLSEVVATTIEEPRSRALLTSIFALITLILAAGGTYSVVAYSVAQRRFDFSVRQALGARPWQLVSETLKVGLTQACGGVGLGLLGSILLARTLSGILYGVSSYDLRTMMGSTLIMLLIVVLASFVPARRVMKGDPASDLRSA